MKLLNVKLWMRYMRLKWSHKPNRLSLANPTGEEDSSIHEFDHHPMMGIDQKFRDTLKF